MDIKLKRRVGADEVVTVDDFEVVVACEEIKEEDLLEENEILAETLWLSPDPYMRCRFNSDTGVDYVSPFPVGNVITGGGLGRVVKSSHPNFPPNSFIMSIFDWPWQSFPRFSSEFLARNEESSSSLLMKVETDSPLSLGALGMPGLTSFFGMEDSKLGKVGEKRGGEEGEEEEKMKTVVVSGAAGAVGSVFGQLAKRLGHKVIGICGSEAKCQWLTETAKLDFAINYKDFLSSSCSSSSSSSSLSAHLLSLCPEGVDVYFDNVGGEMTDQVILALKGEKKARITMCGQIAVYNKDLPYPPPLSEKSREIMEMKGAERCRYLVLRYQEHFGRGFKELAELVKNGEIVAAETVVDGIENAPQAFVSMMNGGNLGKMLVRVKRD